MSSVVKKGYKINLNRIEEGYMYSEISCAATSRGAAKTKLLKNPATIGMQLRGSGEEVNYANLPVVRDKEYDVVEFQGKLVTSAELGVITERRKRDKMLEGFLSDPVITHCYIKKNGSYYCDNHSGYTAFRFNAGVYEKVEAVSCAKSCSDLVIVPINITEHNIYIQKEIKKLESRLIH